MSNIRRQVITFSEANSTLSYQNDLVSSEFLCGNISAHYDRTIAYGTGFAYLYPKAAVANDNNGNDKQVYPPIIDCSLTYVQRGRSNNEITLSITGNTGFVGNIYQTAQGDYHKLGYVDLFCSNIFTVAYNTNFNNSGNVTIQIPDFDPMTQTNSNRWAYILGYNLYINQNTNNLNSLVFPAYGYSLYNYSGSPTYSNLITYMDFKLNPTTNNSLYTSYNINNLIAGSYINNKLTLLRRTADNLAHGIHIDFETKIDSTSFIFKDVDPNINNYSLEIQHNYNMNGVSDGSTLTGFYPLWDPASIDELDENHTTLTSITGGTLCADIPSIITNIFFALDDGGLSNAQLPLYIKKAQSGSSSSAKIQTQLSQTQVQGHRIPVKINSDNYTHGQWLNNEYGIYPMSSNVAQKFMCDQSYGEITNMYSSTGHYIKFSHFDINAAAAAFGTLNDETLIYTDIRYITTNNLFEFHSVDIYNNDELTINIRYYNPTTSTIQASSMIENRIKIRLCANIIVPYYNQRGYLCFAKGLIMSDQSTRIVGDKMILSGTWKLVHYY